MASKGTKNKGRVPKKKKVEFKIVDNPRYNCPNTLFRIMEPVNIRLYHGGEFVARKSGTVYEKGALWLNCNVDEVAYFEIVGWIVDKLKYPNEGEIWYRKRGRSLSNGLCRIESDADIPGFLDAPEGDGFYHLYVVHKKDKSDALLSKNTFGTGSSFNSEGGESGNHESNAFNNAMGGPKEKMLYESSFKNPTCGILSPTISLLNTQLNSPFLQPHPHFRSKIPFISSQKKQLQSFKPPSFSLLPETETENVHDTENGHELETETERVNDNEAETEAERVNENVELETEAEARWTDDDNDAYLSDADYEDKDDDDLFNKYVDREITERVTRSLGFNRGEGEQLNDDEERVIEEEELEDDLKAAEGDDIVDSDDDKFSVIGSDDESDHYPKFNPETDFKGGVKLSKGLKFPSAKVFRKALQHNAIDLGYNYYFLHNNRNRVSVYCRKRCDCLWNKGRIVRCCCKKKRKCKFKIHCKKLKDEESWQIKSYVPKHVCGQQLQNNKLTSQYLAERFLEDFRSDPRWKIKFFMDRVRRDCKVDVGYHKAYYAKQRALRMLFGTAEQEYAKVWDYANAIRTYIPGSTAVVKVTGIDTPAPEFQRLYVCLQPLKEGYIAGCRPIIGVDGAHLKGLYSGILMTAVGKDGNNNIFPVAWAVVETEDFDTWSWFLDLVRNDIASVADKVTWVHEDDELVVMLDRQKGLVKAFKKVMPNAQTRFCCRHIWSNFKKKFPGEVYRQHFWCAARATAKHHFNQQMEKIKGINPDAHKYLADIPVAHWARHAFGSQCKSGMVLNNACESFNNVLRHARTLPILQLMEWIRRYVMERCNAKREGLRKFNGYIMPTIVKMVNKAMEEVHRMTVNHADLVEFEVDHDSDTYVVNLEKRECSCYRWTLMGIPCWHALACIAKLRWSWEDYVHPAYQIATYAATYAPSFRAMPGHAQWEVTPHPRPLPPPHRVMPGRPSEKKRKKEKGEDKEKQQVQRAKKQNRCSRCGVLGHYKSTCKKSLPDQAVNTEAAASSSDQASTQPTEHQISSSAPQ